MFGRLSVKMMMVGALLGLLLTGCGQNPYGYDPYAEAYGYGDAYGSAYSGDTGYDSGYDSGYGSDYSSDYSSDYGSDYSSDSGYDTGYDTGYGSTPTTSPTATSVVAPLPPTDQLPALNAWVEDVKETGFMGAGKVIAKVAVENPSSRTLSGRLEVRFTDNGNLTANKVSERITLGPREKQVLTFTADAWRLDDAEAIVTTDRDEESTGGGSDDSDDTNSEVRDAD